MFLQEVKKAFFSIGPIFRAPSSNPPTSMTSFSEFTEPSPEIRAAVRRRKLGLPNKPHGKPGQNWTGPVTYDTYPVHHRVSTRAGLASSDALIVTRFLLSGADDTMSRLLGKPVEGCNVLDFGLGGLELAWHSDLMLALEDRAAIWSVSRIIQPSGDTVLEHIAMPWGAKNGHLIFVGWYHRIGGSPERDENWSNVLGFVRKQRARRANGFLLETPLTD